MTVTAPNGVYGPARMADTSSYAFTPPEVGSSRQVFSDSTGRRSRLFRVVEAVTKMLALALIALAVAVALDLAGGADDAFRKQRDAVQSERPVEAYADVLPVDVSSRARAEVDAPDGERAVSVGQP